MAKHNSCNENQTNSYPSDCEITQALREKAYKRLEPAPRNKQWKEALPRARNIKILLLDVDGVLTDGNIIYTQDGGESKKFNTQDGFGLRILQNAGIEVGIITARSSEAVRRRAADLKLTHVFQGSNNKAVAYEQILEKTGLKPEQTAYMGDDWLDLTLLCRVGLALAPANAVFEVKQRAHYVTSKPGGAGAVREACELLLEAAGKLNPILKKYLP